MSHAMMPAHHSGSDPAEFDTSSAKIRELRVAARKLMRKKSFVAAAGLFAQELKMHQGVLHVTFSF
jgi:hypothetical protein